MRYEAIGFEDFSGRIPRGGRSSGEIRGIDVPKRVTFRQQYGRSLQTTITSHEPLFETESPAGEEASPTIPSIRPHSLS